MSKNNLTKLLQIWVLVGLISYLWLQICVVSPQEQLRVISRVALGILIFAAIQALILTPLIKYLRATTWQSALELVIHMQLLGQLCLTMPVVLLAPVLYWGFLLLALANPHIYDWSSFYLTGLGGLLLSGWLIGWVTVQRQIKPQLTGWRTVTMLVLVNLFTLILCYYFMAYMNL